MSVIDTPLAVVGNSLSVLVGAAERADRGLPTLRAPGAPTSQACRSMDAAGMPAW